jgi:hypothetical protein
MFDRLQQSLNTVTSRLSRTRYRTAASLKRFARACGYFTASLSEDDAQRIMLDCQHQAGWYPLLILTVEDTLQEARETFVDHPELPRLIAHSCAGVAQQWESHNDELYTARGWAIGLALHYAAEQGITLTRLSEDDDAVKAAPS